MRARFRDLLFFFFLRSTRPVHAHVQSCTCTCTCACACTCRSRIQGALLGRVVHRVVPYTILYSTARVGGARHTHYYNCKFVHITVDDLTLEHVIQVLARGSSALLLLFHCKRLLGSLRDPAAGAWSLSVSPSSPSFHWTRDVAGLGDNQKWQMRRGLTAVGALARAAT